MNLEVLPSDSPWYAQGLRFTCTQCGNCCTGAPGFVWISREEIVRLAEHLKLTPDKVVDRYCRTVNGRFSLKERRTPEGNYDCIFLKEPPPPPGGGKVVELSADEPLPLRRKICSVYPVRPLQCRTWPFWRENLADPANWDRSAQRCHGMNHGKRRFSLRQITALRDAADWPANPPTSGQPKTKSTDDADFTTDAEAIS